jgi:hypothetical protein
MESGPSYLSDVRTYLEEHLNEPTAVVGVLAALLTDPASYRQTKGTPGEAVQDYVHELVLTDRLLGAALEDPATPFSRELFGGRWGTTWRGAGGPQATGGSYEYAICISFAGSERPIAERIARSLRSEPMAREVFYDEFETTQLWGEQLFDYLYDIYARKCMFCLILFSHNYRKRAWTRHELRAAQTRTLTERESYILPVEVNRGAVPEAFVTVGYWPFAPGDEEKIAEAAESKINDWIGSNYLTIDEITDIINKLRVSQALLGGFRTGIQSADDPLVAEALRAVALIATCSSEDLATPVRAVVDWVLFAEGAVGNLFDDDNGLTVFSDARARRWLGAQGPLLFSKEGWEDHLEALLAREDDEEADMEDEALPQ